MENYFEGTIAGLGTIYSCRNLEFDKVLSRYIDDSNELISARDLAFARVSEPKKINAFSRKGSYVKEGSLFVPNSKYKRIWLRESLVLKDSSAAVNAHSQGLEYLLPNTFNVESYLEQIGEDNYFILKEVSNIQTDEFDKDPRTKWLFQDQAKAYGEFLRNNSIEMVKPVEIFINTNKYINSQSGPYANQLWINESHKRLEDTDSAINGETKSLNNMDRVRWVRRQV